jgi:hypothetical protein
MNPTENSNKEEFSPCSAQLMCNGVRTDGNCIVPASTVNAIQAGVCGNGVKEEGEDCDCGAGCADNACCDTTCKFVGPARCDDSYDGCCESCQPLPTSTVCRLSKDFCAGK